MQDIHDRDDDPFEAQRERVDTPMRRLFATYARGDWFPLVLGLVAGVFAHLLSLVPVLVLGTTVDAVFHQTKPYELPLIPAGAVPAGRGEQFWFSVAVVLAAFVFAALFSWAKGWGLNEFAQRVQHAVRADTYDAMQRLDLGFFADKQTGELMSILNNDVNRLEQFLNGGLNMATMLLVNVGGTAAVLFYLNPQLALVTMVALPVIGAFTHVFVQRIQPLYADVRSTVGQLNSRLENNLGGIEVIKASNTEGYESDRVTEASGDYLDTNRDAFSMSVKFFPGLQLTGGFGFVVTFVVGGLWVFATSTGAPAPWLFTGPLSVGDFVIFVFLGQRFVWPMSQFGQVINLYQRASASTARVFGLMDEPAAIPADEDAPDLEVSAGRVVYDDVTFAYEDAADADGTDADAADADAASVDGADSDGDTDVDPILEDVDFAIEGGEMLALVGPTGAGKSTVLKLLLRFYDVDEGAIRIDGQDVRDVSQASLRDAVGYVSQDTYLFYGSVRENIAYGSFDATDDEIVEAARAAEAHEFITELDDGYDTEVGERGVRLSGGQRQRIGIARVLLQDPDILVLDEATSDVDTETELRIQRSIDRLVTDRTVLAIAHRLSTIKDADQILVLDDGRVVERGTHDELLQSDGLYAKLWSVQAGMADGVAVAD